MAESPQRRSKVLHILMVVAAAVLNTVLWILSLVNVISSQAFLLGMLLVFLALGAAELALDARRNKAGPDRTNNP